MRCTDCDKKEVVLEDWVFCEKCLLKNMGVKMGFLTDLDNRMSLLSCEMADCKTIKELIYKGDIDKAEKMYNQLFGKSEKDVQ